MANCVKKSKQLVCITLFLINCLTPNYLESAVFEHQFWLQVLADHSRFIYDSLYPSEIDDISKVASFIHHFDQLLAQVNSLNESDAILFATNVEESVKQLRTFKLSIIERHITSEMKIHLIPTFIII